MLHDDTTTTSEPRTPEEKAAIRQNQQNDMPTVLADLPDEARPFTRIVGKWLWCEFPGKPDPEVREMMVDIGFRWNPKRHVWQHCCGVKSKKSPGDPRQKYGEIAVDAYTNEEE